MTPSQKKDIVKFVAGGLAALALSKMESLINKRADDYFGPDEKVEQED